MVAGEGFEPRSTKRLIYSQIHLAACNLPRPLSRCRERTALNIPERQRNFDWRNNERCPHGRLSFDVVSKLDRQEVDNAVNQTASEIANRHDFRGVDAAITLSGDTISMKQPASRVMATLDVLQSGFIEAAHEKRNLRLAVSSCHGRR